MWAEKSPPPGTDFSVGNVCDYPVSVFASKPFYLSQRTNRNALIYKATRFSDAENATFYFEQSEEGESVRSDCSVTGYAADNVGRLSGVGTASFDCSCKIYVLQEQSLYANVNCSRKHLLSSSSVYASLSVPYNLYIPNPLNAKKSCTGFSRKSTIPSFHVAICASGAISSTPQFHPYFYQKTQMKRTTGSS